MSENPILLNVDSNDKLLCIVYLEKQTIFYHENEVYDLLLNLERWVYEKSDFQIIFMS
jgi:hypothetical protein